MRRSVREGKGHAALELGLEKPRNVINDGGRSLLDTGIEGPIYEEMMRTSSEIPTVAQRLCNASSVKTRQKNF